MVDVPFEHYDVKVEKTIAMLVEGTWIFDRSGTLVDNLLKQVNRCNHEGMVVWEFGHENTGRANEKKGDYKLIDVAINAIDKSREAGEVIPLLIINAGNLFGKFMRSRWLTRADRRDWGSDRKFPGERLNDLVESIQKHPSIKRCVIFNRLPRDDESPFLKSYPRSIDVLETENVVDRVPVTDLVA